MSLLDDISNRGADLRTRVHELLLPHEYSADTKTLLVVGYVDLALEYHKAIWVLKDAKLYGAAFVLVRPVFDAWLRALWINALATAEQIEQASHDELHWPKMDKMLADIKGVYFGHAGQDAEFDAVVNGFFEFLTPLWRVLSGYTHPGARQLARRFTGAQVKASYTEQEINQALNLSTMALMLLMRAFFMSMSKQPEANEVEALLMRYFRGIQRAPPTRVRMKHGRPGKQRNYVPWRSRTAAKIDPLRSPLFELARVLVRLDHVASRIADANHSIM